MEFEEHNLVKFEDQTNTGNENFGDLLWLLTEPGLLNPQAKTIMATPFNNGYARIESTLVSQAALV